MNRVADKNRMIARRATQVAAATRYCVAADCGSSRLLPFPHRRCAHRVMAESFYDAKERNTASACFCRNPQGHWLCGGLRCQAPSEGNHHSRRRLSCIPSRKAECAAMRDLIRGSLKPGASTINRLLNHIEEFLIASFMAAATLITFAAVAMRYINGSGIDWAQELTIYLFIWMAKFGAPMACAPASISEWTFWSTGCAPRYAARWSWSRCHWACCSPAPSLSLARAG